MRQRTQATDATRGAADGTVDSTITSGRGSSTIDRSRGADGLIDSTVTGPKGGVTTTDRSRNADGTTDKTVR